uniref:Allantoinase n=1 Tax=Papilio xuthus TaxID=66420 RepID=I4DL24_PAPXU|nr:allantoinase [Papilio xuthus]
MFTSCMYQRPASSLSWRKQGWSASTPGTRAGEAASLLRPVIITSRSAPSRYLLATASTNARRLLEIILTSNNSGKYIKDHRLDLVASDHSPSVAALKSSNFLESWGGISSVQFGLSLFWTQAKARGFKLGDVSHYLSAGPAQLCGLQNRKGAIRPGLDADLVFFDPNASFVVTPDIIFYKNKISPYMNRVLNGKVIQTYVRGQLVYADGQIIGGPKGQLILKDGF